MRSTPIPTQVEPRPLWIEAGPTPAPTDSRAPVLGKFAIPIGVCVSLVALLRYVTYATRRFWFDEVYTAIIALQPSWADFWKAFNGGLDTQSPVFFVITHTSALLFHPPEFALRLPEMLGILVFSWCMYFFVARRLGPLYGLSAMILPLVSDMELYAGEARPYGLVLAAGGLVLLAWRNAIENPHRRRALPLFALALAFMTAMHAYAIVIVAMFGAAELARYLRSRRPDWQLWCCFAFCLPSLLVYLPGMKTARNFYIGPKMQPHWSDFPLFYAHFFHNRIALLVLFGLLTAGLLLLPRQAKPRLKTFPLHELVLAGLLAFLPIFMIIFARLISGLFYARYAIFGVAGIVLIAILLLDYVAPNRQMAAVSLFLLSAFLFGMDQLRDCFNAATIHERDVSLSPPFSTIPDSMPVVIASGLSFMPIDWYASDRDLSRTWFLTDSEAPIRYGDNNIFNAIPNAAPFHRFRANFADYQAFIREHKKFYAFGPYLFCDSWVIQKLVDEGAKVTRIGTYGGELRPNVLVEVEMPR